MGAFLMVTACLIMLPVVLQIRAGDFKLKEIWAYLLFASGLFAVGAAYAFLDDQQRRTLAGAGVVAMLVGLLAGEIGSRTARRY